MGKDRRHRRSCDCRNEFPVWDPGRGVHFLILILVVLLTTAVASTLTASWMIAGAFVIAALFIIVGLLPLIVGYGFRRRASWVKPAGITLAVLSMVNIPIGTALGIYTIKFFR